MTADPQFVAYDADFAPAAALIGDPARAAMLTALLDGRALAAGELAHLAGVSPATASAHLGRLRDGGLVSVTSRGRHRYYRLAGHEVATALEALAQLGPPVPVRSLRAFRQAEALVAARTCYDHLAGRAGVALLDALLDGGLLTAAGSPPTQPTGREAFAVSTAGEAALRAFGIEIGSLRRTRRVLAGACLDWTERRPHLGGALGAGITARLFDLGWVERTGLRRAVRVTPAGQEGLATVFLPHHGGAPAVWTGLSP